MKFDVVKTSIVNVVSDAVVLPANEQLKEGSGTSRAIFEAAGRKELTKACKELGHCETGSAVPTLAFQLNAKYIIHAAVPRWVDGDHNEYDLLSSAYLAALNIAEVMGCKSIAFPLLAAGHNGFDKELAVRIAEESIASFEGIHLKKVMLVVHSDTMEVFLRGLGYPVTVIPETLLADARKAELETQKKKKADEEKEAAKKLVEEGLHKAIEWAKDPDNRKKMMKAGEFIYNLVIKKKFIL